MNIYRNEFKYIATRHNEVIIMEYIGSSGDVIIPRTIENKPVTEIDNDAFRGKEQILKTVDIRADVKKIMSKTFKDCTALESIGFPETMRFIAEDAFEGCVNLKNALTFHYKRIKGSGIIIEKYFGREPSLIIPATIRDIPVTAIAIRAFCHADSLESIAIPDSVVKIGANAFTRCTSLKSVYLSESLKTVGNWTFCGCSSLQTIYIPQSVTEIGYGAFQDCTALKTIVIPDSVKKIGDKAFMNCSSLERVEIPIDATVTIRAFKDCPAEIIRY